MNEENSLVKKIDLQAAPFSDDFKELTKGQKTWGLVSLKVKY